MVIHFGNTSTKNISLYQLTQFGNILVATYTLEISPIKNNFAKRLPIIVIDILGDSEQNSWQASEYDSRCKTLMLSPLLSDTIH